GWSAGGRRFPVKCANGLLCDPKNSFNCAVAGLRYVRRSFANVLLIDQPGHSNPKYDEVLNESPRVHHAARRRGGVAARGTRAAGRADAAHRHALETPRDA